MTGGTFALYSLLSRTINLRPGGGGRSKQLTRLESDAELRFYGPAQEKETRSSRAFNTKALKFIEGSRFMQIALMWLVMLGTCMVIGDGVLTPAISGKGIIIFMLFSFIELLFLLINIPYGFW